VPVDAGNITLPVRVKAAAAQEFCLKSAARTSFMAVGASAFAND